MARSDANLTRRVRSDQWRVRLVFRSGARDLSASPTPRRSAPHAGGDTHDSPAPRARRRPSTLGRLLPLLLIGALLAPLGLLVTTNWRQITDDRDLAARERLGVQYLKALAAVTDALVEAQSAAVNARPVPAKRSTKRSK